MTSKKGNSLQNHKNTSVSTTIFGIYRLLIISFSILTLYFAKTIVIPLTIAALLTFLLSPLVTRLEKWIGRIASILIVVISVFSVTGIIGYVFARQLVFFGSNFQHYYEVLELKFQAFEFPKEGIFHRLGQFIGNFKDGTPLEFKLIDIISRLPSFVESLFGSVVNILALTGMIILLVVFMLLNREDIRGRVIKLIGQNRIGSTTNAMNEASERVSSYLYLLLIVNIGFGICVAIGLSLIGITNAVLWGCLAAILRFIPYIGPWIAAIIPIALSFIISDTWMAPILTFSFFIVLELITAYVIEPYYYGVGTGVSSFALVVAAIFWTWLWGPIGLLLSTPLTVCLVVLGQYVPNMSFLRVLLSHEKALSPAEECYHRLLSFDSSESMDVIESYLQKDSLVSLYDTLLIPVVAQAKKDFLLGLIDGEQKEGVYHSVREIIEFLGIKEQKEISLTIEPKGNIFCVPAQTTRDEIGVSILSQLIALESLDVHYTTAMLKEREIFDLVDKGNPDVICICVVAPSALSKTRFLCAKLHKQKPLLPIVICILGYPEIGPGIIDKLTSAGATHVVVNLSEAIQTLKEMQPL